MRETIKALGRKRTSGHILMKKVRNRWNFRKFTMQDMALNMGWDATEFMSAYKKTTLKEGVVKAMLGNGQQLPVLERAPSLVTRYFKTMALLT